MRIILPVVPFYRWKCHTQIMAININLDVMMAKRKKSLTDLAGDVDITLANLSILKNNKAKAIRFATLEAICKSLNCQPGDIIEYIADEPQQSQNKKESDIE